MLTDSNWFCVPAAERAGFGLRPFSANGESKAHSVSTRQKITSASPEKGFEIEVDIQTLRE